MVDASNIRPHMRVVGSDGEHVGTVDGVDGDRIKLTRDDSPDGQHHHLALSSIARVDEQVHLSVTRAAALGIAGGAAATASAVESPLPPIRNRAVEGAAPRKNFYLPWIVGAVGLLLLLLLFKSCVDGRQDAAAPPATTAGTTGAVIAQTPEAPASEALAGVSGLGGYLAGVDATPRTFTFERLNFDTAKSEVRAADRAEIDEVAGTLTQYRTARVRIAGYADARGDDAANRTLGQARADAVKAALVAKGIDAGRIETTTGGETDPVGSNATAGGQFENRRTELVVLAR